MPRMDLPILIETIDRCYKLHDALGIALRAATYVHTCHSLF